MTSGTDVFHMRSFDDEWYNSIHYAVIYVRIGDEWYGCIPHTVIYGLIAD